MKPDDERRAFNTYYDEYGEYCRHPTPSPPAEERCGDCGLPPQEHPAYRDPPAGGVFCETFKPPAEERCGKCGSIHGVTFPVNGRQCGTCGAVLPEPPAEERVMKDTFGADFKKCPKCSGTLVSLEFGWGVLHSCNSCGYERKDRNEPPAAQAEGVDLDAEERYFLDGDICGSVSPVLSKRARRLIHELRTARAEVEGLRAQLKRAEASEDEILAGSPIPELEAKIVEQDAEITRLERERDEARADCKLAAKWLKLGRRQLEELQKENTAQAEEIEKLKKERQHYVDAHASVKGGLKREQATVESLRDFRSEHIQKVVDEQLATLRAKHERLREAARGACNAYWHSDSADAEIDALLDALRDEEERLRECMKEAGLQAFMRERSPEEVAKHLREVAAVLRSISYATLERERDEAEDKREK